MHAQGGNNLCVTYSAQIIIMALPYAMEACKKVGIVNFHIMAHSEHNRHSKLLQHFAGQEDIFSKEWKIYENIFKI
jgi:hypothetical protein